MPRATGRVGQCRYCGQRVKEMVTAATGVYPQGRPRYITWVGEVWHYCPAHDGNHEPKR